MSRTPFKLKSPHNTSFKEMGSSPMLHPHDTMREAKSHPVEQVHTEDQPTEDQPTQQPKLDKEIVEEKKTIQSEGKKGVGVRRPTGNYQDEDGNWRNKHGEIISEEQMKG